MITFDRYTLGAALLVLGGIAVILITGETPADFLRWISPS